MSAGICFSLFMWSAGRRAFTPHCAKAREKPSSGHEIPRWLARPRRLNCILLEKRPGKNHSEGNPELSSRANGLAKVPRSNAVSVVQVSVEVVEAEASF